MCVRVKVALSERAQALSCKPMMKSTKRSATQVYQDDDLLHNAHYYNRGGYLQYQKRLHDQRSLVECVTKYPENIALIVSAQKNSVSTIR